MEQKKDNTLTFNESSATNLSPWFSNMTKPIKFNKLNEDINVDVVIVGGGIAGLSSGYILSNEGKSIAIVEDGYIGSGETSHTTAHITAALDDRYYNLETTVGLNGARIAAQSHTHALNFIESVVDKEKIDCEFERVDGYLFLDPSDTRDSLQQELEATHRAGLIDTQIVAGAPIDSFVTGLCIKFPNQGQFHPLKYLEGLATAIISKNGKIFTETHAQEISDNEIKTSDGHIIKAKNIIIATNAPIIDKSSKIYDKQIPYRTYVIGALIKKDSIPTALYWDTGNKDSKNNTAPYHYVRIQKLEYDDKTKNNENDNNIQYDILIVGGEDHKTGNENDIEKRHNRLIEWTKARFPIEKIVYRWSGQVMEPFDSLAFIGLNPSSTSTNNENKNNGNVYIATGDSGNGITHGTISGILLSDLILGRKNEWSKLYDPARPIKNKEKDENKNGNRNSRDDKNNKDENRNTNIQKNKNQTLSSIKEELSTEQGMIIDENPNDPIAVYKDIDCNLHTFSAKCTHMGCTITWNPLEKSFDCPCHGSRFYNNGKVINAPANNPLSAKKLE